MKKTLTINLGGRVFHIDEDAYQALYQYLESLRNHFGRSEASGEILTDIEGRISELFTDWLAATAPGERQAGPSDRKGVEREVITMEDVNRVMSLMGKPADFGEAEETPHGATDNGKGDKRFFRNPDEKLLAGVCSGIAAWFRIDPVWVRLAFVLFTLAGGWGILIYLVLWLVVPEAQSASDRLAMRGKKVNIGSIAGEVADAVRRAGAETRPLLAMLAQVILRVLTILWRVVVVLTGILLVVAATGMLIVLLAYVLGWTGNLNPDGDHAILSFPSLAKIIIGCDIPVTYLQVTLLMVLGIPLAMLFYNGLRMVFRFERIRHLGLTVFNIWIVGLFLLSWIGLRTYNLVRHHEEKQIDIPLQNPETDTLTIALFEGDQGLKYLTREPFNIVGDHRAIRGDQGELLLLPKIRITESDDSLCHITQVTLGRGKTKSEAFRHMGGIRFRSASSGPALLISPFVEIPGEACWRGQAVNLTIRVPRGKFVKIDPELLALDALWPSGMRGAGIFRMAENGPEATETEPGGITEP